MISSHSRIRAKFAILPFAFFLVCTGPTGCMRSVRVTKQMTWECAPEEAKPGYYARPDEYVRFRFVENPHCFDLESSRNFCAEMKKAGRSIVDADFEISGRGQSVQGYRMLSVDGRPLQDVGGWGSAGANDYQGPSPIAIAFRSH